MGNVPPVSRACTLVGLIFEGLGLIGLFIAGFFLLNPPQVLINAILEENLPDNQQSLLFFLFDLMGITSVVLGFIVMVVFVINLYLFSGLLKGKFTEEKMKQIALYQAIWGGINLVFNQLTGVLYLVSGIVALNQNDKEQTREGL